MKRILLIFALLLVPALAIAGSNIKQKDTGATVWEDSKGNQVPVGNPGLVVVLGDLSEASTAYVVSHKSGNIVKIYSVTSNGGVNAGLNAVNTLDFGISLPNGIHIAVSSENGTGNISIASAVSDGEMDSVTFTPGTDTSIAISAGDAIYAHTDGAGASVGISTDAIITIIIE